MSVGIRFASVSTAYRMRLINPWEQFWLCEYDPNAHQGLGQARFTDDPAAALRFESFADAEAFWNQQSEIMPTIYRPVVEANGEIHNQEVDNRPLTCCSITVDDLATGVEAPHVCKDPESCAYCRTRVASEAG